MEEISGFKVKSHKIKECQKQIDIRALIEIVHTSSYICARARTYVCGVCACVYVLGKEVEYRG